MQKCSVGTVNGVHITKKHETAERNIQPASSSLKASLWECFGFYKVEGKKDVDKSHSICKLCRTKLKYFLRFSHSEKKKCCIEKKGPSRCIGHRFIASQPFELLLNRLMRCLEIPTPSQYAWWVNQVSTH